MLFTPRLLISCLWWKAEKHINLSFWRVAGVVERGGLENRCGPQEATEGSNPSLSARFFPIRKKSTDS